jgi:peptidoglycan/LPS O-acetylase OafA/YrhL
MTEGKALKTAPSVKNLRYFPVLDALRFLLAFWVAVGHLGMIPLLGDPSSGTGIWFLVKRGWNTIVFGTPAVIVFFVISGFCIHLPFRGASRIDVSRFYLRRYTRILIPVAAALLLYRILGQHLILWGEHSVLWHSPLWSLLCEEIYYALYPALRWLRGRFGWRTLLPVSFLISIPISAMHPRADWHVHGPLGTAMILLPVWLLGCLLAEQSDGLLELTPQFSIWFWRLLAWFGCWVSEMLHFKLKISYTQTMLWFGVLAYFWVRQEIINGKIHPPNRFLVAAGAWSYSLYLVHAQGAGIYGWFHLSKLPALAGWFGAMASSLLFAYCFYLLVERPSHRLARKFKVRTGPTTSEAQPVAAGMFQNQ